ncbi:hypothetical protein B1A_01605, partial [mine drainage metagenome]
MATDPHGEAVQSPLRRLKTQVRKVVQKVGCMDGFNRLTSPQRRDPLEALLPAFRERLYPPTVIGAMFLGYGLSADGSSQNAAIVARMLSGFRVRQRIRLRATYARLTPRS